jgi:rod shape-determining protein MreC
MTQARSTRRRGITYALLVAFSLLLLGASSTAPAVELRRAVGFAMSPVQGALARATRSATSIFTAFAEIERLRRDNQELQAHLQRLEAENRQLEHARSQNEELTAVLDLRSALAYETVPAEVISRRLSEFERVVVLDHGSDHGIGAGDAVLGSGGVLVGQVAEVGRNFSFVTLLADTRSVVIGLVPTSGATGEVLGRLSEPLAMTKIPSTEQVTVGDLVVAAGLDLGNGIRSPFPRGILIGRVLDVQSDPNAVVQMARIAPATNLEMLEYLLVVTAFEAPGPISSPGGVPLVTPRPGDATEAPSR